MTGIAEVVAIGLLYMPLRTNAGRRNLEDFPYSSSTSPYNFSDIPQNLYSLIETSGSGSAFNSLKIQNEDTTGGNRYLFPLEAPHALATTISTESVSSMLAKIKSVFALSITDLSKIVNVERPTIYAWMSEKASPHEQNVGRLKELFNIAKESEKYIVTLPQRQIKQFQIQDSSLVEILCEDNLDKDLLLSGLENIKFSIDQDDKGTKKNQRINLEKFSQKYNILPPSEKTMRDVFDLETGKRTDPDLE